MDMNKPVIALIFTGGLKSLNRPATISAVDSRLTESAQDQSKIVIQDHVFNAHDSGEQLQKKVLDCLEDAMMQLNCSWKERQWRFLEMIVSHNEFSLARRLWRGDRSCMVTEYKAVHSSENSPAERGVTATGFRQPRDPNPQFRLVRT